jgi:hypothetical protein
MISTSTSYQIITKDLARTKALIEKEPVTKREIEYHQANIKKIKTINEFIKNDRLFKFAMKAYGLEDMAYGKGLMTKLLQEGVSNPLSMANKMSNPLYKEFAKAFDFAGKGQRQPRLRAQPPMPSRSTSRSRLKRRKAIRTRRSARHVLQAQSLIGHDDDGSSGRQGAAEIRSDHV